MQQSSQISVIIPTLNEEHTLPLLLKSLQQQTLKPMEIIHVDAHSDDHTVKRAQAFTSSLPLTTVRVTTRNVSFQRNQGANNATGAWLLFLDADVTLPASFLADFQRQLPKNTAVCYNFRAKYMGNSFFYQSCLKVYNGLVRLLKSSANPPVGEGCFAVKRQAFLASRGFKEQLQHSEGRDLVLRIKHLQSGSLDYLHHPFYFYNVRRLERMGSWNLIKTYTRMWFSHLLPTIVTSKLKTITYPMHGGGQK